LLLKLFFSSRTTTRRSSSSLSSLLLYRYVLLMRMLSFSISLSQLLSRSSRFLSVYIPRTHVLVLSFLHISVIQLPSVFLQFCWISLYFRELMIKSSRVVRQPALISIAMGASCSSKYWDCVGSEL
jgi:hypothetical protein